MDEVMDKLSKTAGDLGKARKAADKLYERAMTLDDPSTHLKKQLTDMASVMKVAEMTHRDLSYLMKFKEDSKGAKLNLSSAQQMQQMAANCVGDLVEVGKCLKGFLSKAKKED